LTPVNPSIATTYEVLDRDGKVTVHATKNDVYIDANSKNPKEVKNPSRSSREIVRESEQKSREEKCGGAYVRPASGVSGLGAWMNSPWAIGAGAAAIAGLTTWVLVKDDDPISPSCPTKNCPTR